MSVIINGDFLCRNLTGIERFAYETCIRLDSIIKKDEVTIYIPNNAHFIPDFKNINIVKSNKSCTVFPLWEHITFSRYVKKCRATSLDFANVTPLFRAGIVFIHDIYAKLYPKDFTGKKDTLIRLYMCFMYHHACKKAKKLITVSEFSKSQISNIYKVPMQDIEVIYNGWEHFRDIKQDDSIFSRYPSLKKGDFYFTLGSLQKRKNLKWISQYAKEHPKQVFAISGKAISGMVSEDIKDLQTLRNVILPGYVTDEEVKALMTHCKAFLFPSYYEGFGIPPLEALSCGSKIIISNSACLPELYKDTAIYIEPDNTNVNLDELLKQPTSPAEPLLKKYSYQKAAENLYKIIKEF